MRLVYKAMYTVSYHHKGYNMFDKFLDAVMEIIAYTEGENTWGELEIDQ